MECILDHFVLNVRDPEAMIAFYRDVLLLKPLRLQSFERGAARFPSVRLNALTVIDFYPPQLWGDRENEETEATRLHHFCLVLPTLWWRELVERLERAAVPIIEGPDERWGARGKGTSIYFEDPEGNLLEARYYPNRESSCDGLIS